jgi:hypothetical protein
LDGHSGSLRHHLDGQTPAQTNQIMVVHDPRRHALDNGDFGVKNTFEISREGAQDLVPALEQRIEALNARIAELQTQKERAINALKEIRSTPTGEPKK